jgi:UV DNA damage endonuclease
MNRPMRLGFPVKVMGRPGLRSNDTRRWRQNPHLKTSLQYVDAILDYLVEVGIDMYRLSSDLAPSATHPDMPQFHDMVAESDAELAALGRKARALDMRLSFHPSQFVLLNSPRCGADKEEHLGSGLPGRDARPDGDGTRGRARDPRGRGL